MNIKGVRDEKYGSSEMYNEDSLKGSLGHYPASVILDEQTEKFVDHPTNPKFLKAIEAFVAFVDEQTQKFSRDLPRQPK